ncbi:acetoacetate decarboxylase [Clostridium aceticum]|uniref:Acetoacetate decarboxylase n=1 Tax=Clostridium aceticum TaxID=84022 RepID=A0A0D8IAV8_9CLOT|nr:acetoacetate decarboxylase family protein [Clostridium aceticum]AKL97316.1 acetoacetate decarboxylase [Clostridium aceticum]KJF26331.1 acetoacetate decarboxylase [Clostridium aceticum]
MIKGYTLPRTPKGKSSLVPSPPWHYVGNVLAVEYTADHEKVAAFLPEGLTLASNQCAIYFIEWQYTNDLEEVYLDPVCSQYRETIVLLSASYNDTPVSYCPFIWVDQDKALMRGLIQGWPKQMGETWMTRSYDVDSKASPLLGKGGRFGAALSVGGRRLAETKITLLEESNSLPSPAFASAVNVRYFPELIKDKYDKPSVHQLVQLKSRDVRISSIWKGEASMEIFHHPHTELPDLKPTSVIAGYRFSVALTVDDLIHLYNLKQEIFIE